MTLLVGCAWDFRDEPRTGVLRISFGSSDQISGLDFGDYYEATFFVVEADYFRRGGRVIPVGPSGDFIVGEGEGFRTEFIRGNLFADRQGFTVDEIIRPAEGDFLVVAGGRAMYLDDGGLEEPGVIEFGNLIVGKEYVVWIDAETWEDGYHLGFSTVRIRSGAPTTVTVNLSEDRFPQFLDLLYDRYVRPFLQPIKLSDFSMVLYAGTGSATIVFDDLGEPLEEVQTYTRALVARVPIPVVNVNVFFLLFFEDDGEFGGEPALMVYFFEQGGILEPARTSYGLALSDPETYSYSFSPGTLFGVQGSTSDLPLFAFEIDPDDPPTLSQAGFSGGGPSKGGTFRLGISGTGILDFGEGFDLGDIAITDLSFTFGPVLETFTDLEGEFPIRPPETSVVAEPIDWFTALEDLEWEELVPYLQVGDRVTVTLPPAPEGYAVEAVLWGDLVYTDDSEIGGAAVHAGFLTLAGGTVTLEVLPGRDFYPSTTRNGITSTEWNTFWYRSFQFVVN